MVLSPLTLHRLLIVVVKHPSIMRKKKSVYLLTGDIGGTNSRMSLYAANSPCDSDKPLAFKKYRNEIDIPEEIRTEPTAFSKRIVAPFLQYCWTSIEDLDDLDNSDIVVCLATAGFVQDNRVNMTNLGNLLVDGSLIQNEQSDPYLNRIVLCEVINDFVAQGYGCLTLHQDEVELLYGPPNALENLQHLKGPKVCVGAGTGLGECYLTPYPDDDSLYQCFASEGGHVEYAPHNDHEVELWKYLMDKHGGKNRVSLERVVSGKGLASVYEFLAHTNPEMIQTDIHQEFLYAGDEQGAVVGVNAHTSGDSLFRQAMKIMMTAYGGECGNAAIKFIPTGGLFVTGGLTPKNMEFIRGSETEFMIAYMNKSRLKPLLEKVPLFAVLTENLGVRGVHKAAKTLYEQKYLAGGIVGKKRSVDNEHVMFGVGLVTGILLGLGSHVLSSRRK